MAGIDLDPLTHVSEERMHSVEGIVPIGDIPGTISTIKLAEAVQQEAARVLANWSMRIATLPVFRAVPELALDDLQEDMPALLGAILGAVRVSPYELDPGPREEAAAQASAHGVKRSLAFSVDIVLSEIQALQREVRNAVWRVSADAPVEVVHELDERLNEVFEIAERSAVAAWVRARYGDKETLLTGEAA